jgi:hypothetical protein
MVKKLRFGVKDLVPMHKLSRAQNEKPSRLFVSFLRTPSTQQLLLCSHMSPMTVQFWTHDTSHNVRSQVLEIADNSIVVCGNLGWVTQHNVSSL